MRRSGSDSSETANAATQPATQPAVPASLARLRNAFESGGDDHAAAAPTATAPTPDQFADYVTATPNMSANPFHTDAVAAPGLSQDATQVQSSPIDLDRPGTANFFTSSPSPYAHTNASAMTSPAKAAGEGHSEEATPMHAPAGDAGGASGARQYFHIPTPSPQNPMREEEEEGEEDARYDGMRANVASAATGGGPLFSAQRVVTHHDLGDSSDNDAAHVNMTNDNHNTHPEGGNNNDAAAQQLRSGHITPPPDARRRSCSSSSNNSARSSRSSSSAALSPPRSPGPRLTPEEEQMARLRAYNEIMGDDAASGAGHRSFIGDTFATILPDRVVQWFSGSGNGEVVAEQSSSAVPEGVKHAASVAANTIGSGAQKIGGVIEAMPGLMVSAIPNQVMSQEMKQLLFTDFSNTFRNFFHTNILSMPFIIRQAGLIGGIFLLTFVAITSEYATEAYFGAKNQMKNAHKVVLYGDVPRMVWGQWYPMINLFYGITHLIGFIAFSASNSVVLLGAMGMTGGGARALGLIIPSLIALPLVLMKNSHSQEPLSMMSNLLVFTAVILMFVDFPYAPVTPIKLWPSSATEFFVAMGVSVYAFTGIGSAIPVERGMPARRYRKLLRASVGIAWAILLAFGLSGFLSYGDRTCSVMTVSLQAGPLRTAVSALLFFASIMIIPQQTFPLCELSDRRILGLTRLTEYWDLKPNLLRITYLILSAFAAFIVPYYGLLLSISGALGCGIVGLVVPAALDYVRRERKGLHHNRNMRFYEYIIVFGLGLYGCVVVVIGVVSGSYQLWISIQTQSTSSC